MRSTSARCYDRRRVTRVPARFDRQSLAVADGSGQHVALQPMTAPVRYVDRLKEEEHARTNCRRRRLHRRVVPLGARRAGDSYGAVNQCRGCWT
jgi:hypothetical protein